jgi:nucleoid-associated protein YgaU
VAERAFTVTELRRTGDGGLVDTPVKFEWTAAGHSAPATSWQFGLEQRTAREDYPGAEEPVEQVLGPNFKEFTVSGTWDDKYNFGGFALDTYRAFEALVQRGSLVRLEFETISITGLLKTVNFNYRRASYIGYEFTFSPHYRVAGSLTRSGPVRKKTPDALKPPTEYRDAAGAAVDTLEATTPNAAAFVALQAGDFGPAVRQRTCDIRTAFNAVVTAIDQRLDPKVEEFEALKRVVAGMVAMRGQAAGMLTELAGAKSSANLAYQDAVSLLDFDTWTRSTKAYARVLALTGHQGAEELSRRVQPRAIALYYPSKGESLYGISQRFYGTPSRWRQISERNGLTALTLQGTEALIIPERR